MVVPCPGAMPTAGANAAHRYAVHGSTAGTFKSVKCRTLRVASVACREMAMPAI